MKRTTALAALLVTCWLPGCGQDDGSGEKTSTTVVSDAGSDTRYPDASSGDSQAVEDAPLEADAAQDAMPDVGEDATEDATDAEADAPPTPANWLHSHDPSLLVVTSDEVQWTPGKPHTILLNLPQPESLSSVGDAVEFRYRWLSDGDARMPGCTTMEGDVCRAACSDCPMEGSTHPCHQIDCDHDDDIACLAGTGDFRIGVFDSDGHGRVDDHGFGETNDVFVGYLGYQWRFHPHVCDVLRYTELKADCSTESHTNVTAWKRDEPEIDPCSEELLGDCDPRPWARIFDPVDACFDLEPNTFGDLVLRVERISATEVRLQFTFNGVGPFEIVDDDTTNQPSKIDVLALHFSNARPYSAVILQNP